MPANFLIKDISGTQHEVPGQVPPQASPSAISAPHLGAHQPPPFTPRMHLLHLIEDVEVHGPGSLSRSDVSLRGPEDRLGGGRVMEETIRSRLRMEKEKCMPVRGRGIEETVWPGLRPLRAITI